jgi:hypothetical protein
LLTQSSDASKKGGFFTIMIGTSASYCWWLVAFQLFGLCLSFRVVNIAENARLRLSAFGLLAVLTASVFTFTGGLNSFAPFAEAEGDYKPLDEYGSFATSAVSVLFAGAVVCAVADALMLSSLGLLILDTLELKKPASTSITARLAALEASAAASFAAPAPKRAEGLATTAPAAVAPAVAPAPARAQQREVQRAEEQYRGPVRSCMQRAQQPRRERACYACMRGDN